MKDEFYLPANSAIALQNVNNKQGRSAEKVTEGLKKQVFEVLEKGEKDAYRRYEALIKTDIARELARVTLPFSPYTEWYWQIDLHNFFRFLMLRLDPHAQLEIREYAEVMHSIGENVCPIAFEAFESISNAVKFSRNEMTAPKNLFKGKSPGFEGKNMSERFEAKLGITGNKMERKGLGKKLAVESLFLQKKGSLKPD